MTLRSIPDSFDNVTLAAIDDLLASTANDYRVNIPLAIESGSRAWGFPSPDSDYDCRFIYVRSSDQYLSPWVPRDVIETPLVGDLDVNGWDLGKALRLMLKGNAVIIEWLCSPIIYQGNASFRDAFLDIAQRRCNRTLIGRHYLHLGESQRKTYFGDGKDVALKKLFYALRPAAALRWMRSHPESSIPPMHFPTLMSECNPPDDVNVLVEELLVKKSETRELGSAPLSDTIKSFVDNEFAQARHYFDNDTVSVSADARDEIAKFFKQWVEYFAE